MCQRATGSQLTATGHQCADRGAETETEFTVRSELLRFTKQHAEVFERNLMRNLWNFVYFGIKICLIIKRNIFFFFLPNLHFWLKIDKMCFYI